MEMWLLLLIPLLVLGENLKDPGLHLATDNEILLRRQGGAYKMGYNTADGHFRVEQRTEDGQVKGVYSAEGPDGKEVLHTYPVPLSQLGLELPPLPYSLQPKAGQRKFPAEIEEEEEEEKKQKSVLPPLLRNFQLHPYGKEIQELDAVVIEPALVNKQDLRMGPVLIESEDYDDIVIIGGEDGPFGALSGSPPSGVKEEDESIGQAQQVPGVPFPIKPGQPVSVVMPQGTAIAGAGGSAQARPGGTALVGPGGVAISTPTGTSVVGPGGVAISAPVASSQAGAGGVAISGGQAISISGVENPEQQLDFLQQAGLLGGGEVETDEAGFLLLRSGYNNRPSLGYSEGIKLPVPVGGQLNAYPIVVNYFFNTPLSVSPMVEGEVDS